MSFKKLGVFALVSAGLCLIISAGLNASERQECNRWMHEAEGRASWYSTTWQRSQCHAHGIILPDEGKTIESLEQVSREVPADVAEVICSTPELNPHTCKIEIK